MALVSRRPLRGLLNQRGGPLRGLLNPRGGPLRGRPLRVDVVEAGDHDLEHAREFATFGVAQVLQHV